MAALKRLRETTNGHNADWYFHYYGDSEAHVRKEADRYGVMDRVVLHGMVSRTEALSAVRGAAVAIVITSVFHDGSLEDNGIVTGKVFEPLGLGIPILLIAPPGSDARKIIEETDSGRGFVGADIEGMVRFISQLSQRMSERSTGAHAYSWPAKAAQLNSILRRVVASSQTAASEMVNGRTENCAYVVR
jgi:glycosyltransferase involved in cell wall biosynthesis